MFKFMIVTLATFTFSWMSYAKVDLLNTKHIPGELIVKFKDQKSISSSVVSLSSEVKKSFRASQAQLFKFPPVMDLEKVISELENDPNVEFVELNAVYQLQALPNDAQFSELYGLHNEGQTGGTADADIDAPEAWEEVTGSKDILVGVIDTGIDYTHEDLKDNYWTNPGESGFDAEGNDKSTNGIDDDQNGYIDDYKGWDFINGDNDPMDGNAHGTHCAGTIGAVGNNGIGVAGVNWNVSLVGLKIFSDAGSTTSAAIIEAIEYSTKIGVDVTNNSWGGGPSSEAMKAAIKEASDAEILFIAAAGNNGRNTDSAAHYPSGYDIPNVVSVAAIDHKDELAYFSNYGAETVDIAAPGVDVLSTVPGNKYEKFSGTSMATPHVTGLTALIKNKFPKATMAQLKARLINTGDVTNALNGKVFSGRRINALNSIEIDDIAPNAPSDLALVSKGISSVHISWTAAGDDGDQGEASSYEIRISDQPITDDNWNSARRAFISALENSPNTVATKVSNLALNSSGYIAIKALDNLGNYGPLSDNLSYETAEVELTYQNAADDLNDFEVNGPWGIEEKDGFTYITESPDGNYENKQNINITSNEINVANISSILMLRTKYDIETRFDNAFIEISVNGSDQWTELAKFTGTAEWETHSYDLEDHIKDAQSFRLRFRITTDTTQVRDGWKIDDISIISAKAE